MTASEIVLAEVRDMETSELVESSGYQRRARVYMDPR
jgi:hypothetical protein